MWGGAGGVGDFVAQMVCTDRFLWSIRVGRLDSGLFFTLFMNAFFMGPEQGPTEGWSEGSQ